MADRKIPKSIKPCPIVSAIVEIRFESSMPFTDMQRIVFGQLKDKIDDVIPVSIPPDFPEHEIENMIRILYISNQFSVGLGYKSLLFETRDEYPLWKNFFPFIHECIKLISEKLSISEIKRISTRYINIFDTTMEFNDIFDITVDLKLNSLSRRSIKVNSEFQIDDKIIILNLSDRSAIQTPKKLFSGYLLDIDVIQLSNLPRSFGEDLLQSIEAIHSLEKDVFFDLLKRKYVNLVKSDTE